MCVQYQVKDPRCINSFQTMFFCVRASSVWPKANFGVMVPGTCLFSLAKIASSWLPWSEVWPFCGSPLKVGISAAYADCGPPPLHSLSLFVCCFFSILLNIHFGICWCGGSPAILTTPYFSVAFPNPNVGRSTLSLLTSCDSVYGCLWPLAAPQTVFPVKPHLDLALLRGKRNTILYICLKNFY